MGKQSLVKRLEDAGRSPSAFGLKVINLLDELFNGIYHISTDALTHKRTQWESDRFIQITLYGTMSTFDDSRLTNLVLLCHREAIRCEIAGAANGYLKLGFSPRQRTGTLFKRHPSIDEVVAKFQAKESELAEEV